MIEKLSRSFRYCLVKSEGKMFIVCICLIIVHSISVSGEFVLDVIIFKELFLFDDMNV